MKELAKKLYNDKYKINQVFLDIAKIQQFADGVLTLLFPQLNASPFKDATELEDSLIGLQNQLCSIIRNIKLESGKLKIERDEICKRFFDELPNLELKLEKDAIAIFNGDPASESKDEVIICYPGFFAIAIYRLAHIFYNIQVPILPRILTEYAHTKTGIDIHPGAKIGENFFIDHGTGIVIGETTEIGDNVKIYQGVTLGALSVDKKMMKSKRHPTIENDCIIYSGATILGGETVIGQSSIIGGNVWLTDSVAPNSMVYHQSEIKLRKSEK